MNEPTDWEKLEFKLVQLFKSNGSVGGGFVHILQEAELKCGIRSTETFVGYQILCDSFKAFSIETLNSLKVPTSRPFGYANYVARLSSLFKQLRASEILYLNGYPWQGYTLLRVIVEQTQIRLAVLNGLYDDGQVVGLVDGEMPKPKGSQNRKNEADKLEIKRALRIQRTEVEKEIFKLMSGTKSGLTLRTIEELRKWDDMFDNEIHGLTYSSLEAMDWLMGAGGLPILPTHSDDGTTMYVNRYAEVSWMLHRLMPLLQLPQHSLSTAWAEKWQALDNSFLQFSKGMEGIGKPIGPAIIEFVTTKFPYDASSRYPAELKK